MTIPQRFVEAYTAKCPNGVWMFTVYDEKTQTAKDFRYSLTQTWELIDSLATQDRERAIEILGYFGFEMPKRPRLKVVQDEDDHATNRFAQVEMD